MLIKLQWSSGCNMKKGETNSLNNNQKTKLSRQTRNLISDSELCQNISFNFAFLYFSIHLKLIIIGSMTLTIIWAKLLVRKEIEETF